MIIIKNTQKKIKINPKKIENYVNKLLEILKYKDFDIGIWFTTNATIKKYNKKFRKKDKPTDILSFPFYPDLKPGERINPKTHDEQNLGDIIISLEYAQKDAHANMATTKNSTNLDEHIKILLVHGICHLIGYDHETDQDYAIMHKKELALLEKIQD